MKNVIIFSVLFSGTAVFSSAGSPEIPAGDWNASRDYVMGEMASMRRELDEVKNRRKETGIVSEFSEKIKMTGYLQPLYAYTEPGVSGGQKIGGRSAFSINTFRMRFEGALKTPVSYVVEFSMGEKSSQFQLQDASININLVPDLLNINFGQMKCVDYNGPPRYWEFIDGSNSGQALAWVLRDRGLLFNGAVLGKKFSYELQFVNGSGIEAASGGTNDNSAFKYGALVWYNPFGPLPVYRNDLERTPFAFSIGIGAHQSRNQISNSLPHEDSLRWRSVGLRVKGRGFYNQTYFASQRVDNNIGTAKNQDYWVTQFGYAIPAWSGHIFEPLFRYELLNADKDTADSEQSYITAGFNYYLQPYKSRFQLNYVFRGEQGANKLNNDTLQAAYSILF